MKKVHGEIEYYNDNGSIHSDICPPECNFDMIDESYVKYLHDCLDEWLNHSNGTGGFYIKSEIMKMTKITVEEKDIEFKNPKLGFYNIVYSQYTALELEHESPNIGIITVIGGEYYIIYVGGLGLDGYDSYEEFIENGGKILKEIDEVVFKV